MSQRLEILIPEFGELDDSEWSRAESAAIKHYSGLLKSYPSGPIEGSVTIRNIGLGADWRVVVIAVGLFFAIPEAHKKITDSVEEWSRIFQELRTISSWVIGEKPALYPNEYLFLVALSAVVERLNLDQLIFLGVTRLPEKHPDLADLSALLFSFADDDRIYQVAVGRNGQFLWENEFSLPPKPKSLPGP